MSKDIKKALEHCVEWKCDNCPNGNDLGSGEIVCRGRLLPQVLEYVADIEAKLEQSQKEKELDNAFWKQECDSLQKALAEKEKAKTDFAIEKLEKVKEFCNNPLVQNVYGNIPEFRVENFIDNQIKELKEKTNVKD